MLSANERSRHGDVMPFGVSAMLTERIKFSVAREALEHLPVSDVYSRSWRCNSSNLTNLVLV